MSTSVLGVAAGELPAPARVASRLDLLLNLVSSTSSDPAQIDHVLGLISQSGLLAHVPSDETQHKLTVRISSLISSQNALGYRLAHLWIQQDPAVWNDHLVSNASTWATQIVNLLSAPEKLLTGREMSDVLLAAALQFASTHLFSEGIAARQEFYRQVVHPNLPKFAIGLTQLLEAIVTKQESEGVAAFASHLHTVLVFINRLLHAHSAQFRPVSSRIHEAVISLLFRDEAHLVPQPIYTAAASVLSSLHLTGALASKGSEASGGNARTTQSQLWQATLENHLQLTSEAWRHATSAYQATDASQATSGAEAVSPKGLQPYAKDPLTATKTAHQRLSLFLGSRGRPGLINLHLRAATARPVPVAVGKLLTLALDVLRIDLGSRFKPTAEAKVSSLQASYLPTLHVRALALIAQLAMTAPAAMPLEASRVLGDICRLAEASDVPGSRVKLAAIRTLAVLVGRQGIALPLDPAGRTTLRLARLAVSQVARTVLQPSAAPQSSAAGDARKAKKARLYESDSMFGSSVSPKDRIHLLSPEEIACTLSALHILTAVYPLLTTSLSAVHFDQATLCIQTTLALVETLSDSMSTYSSSLRTHSFGSSAPTGVELLVGATEAVGEMCLDATSSTLALILPRVIPALTRVAYAPSGAGDARVRSAAERALVAVQASRKGKFIPVAKGVGFGPRAGEDLEGVPEGAKLGDIGRAIPATGEEVEERLVGATTAVFGALGVEKAQAEDAEEAEEQGEERMDVDAIAAESNELFQAGGADASTTASAPASSGSNLGLGLPTSPIRAPADKRIFSPDPVKPSHRPTTPRIGSPSTASHLQTSALSRAASPSLEASSSSGGAVPGRLTPGRTRYSPTAAALAKLTSEAVESAAQVVPSEEIVEAVEAVLEAAEPAARETTTTVVQEDVVAVHDADDDDDDEAMPEIDIGDSDEDDEEEE